MRTHRIAGIPGDGIGTEVIPPAVRALDTLGERFGFGVHADVVVRENVEGEDSEIGGRPNRGFPEEMAVQEAVFIRANPPGALWSASMMPDHLDEPEAAAALMTGLEHALAADTVRTPDLAGTATTDELTDAVIAGFPTPREK